MTDASGDTDAINTQVLFGSRNTAKYDHFRVIFRNLPVSILKPSDLGINIDVTEDGKTPEENARKKANEYYLHSKIPTFSIDAGLYIDKFPAEKQPGPFVRRIYNSQREATDEEMLEYYTNELIKVGGESKGQWITAIALVISPDKIFSQTYPRDTLLKSEKSKRLIPGAPLSSIQFDSASGKYYSEMEYVDRVDSSDALGFVEFLKKYMEFD